MHIINNNIVKWVCKCNHFKQSRNIYLTFIFMNTLHWSYVFFLFLSVLIIHELIHNYFININTWNETLIFLWHEIQKATK